jgi:hypothetical protein
MRYDMFRFMYIMFSLTFSCIHNLISQVENTVEQLLYMAGDKTVRGAFSCSTGNATHIALRENRE